MTSPLWHEEFSNTYMNDRQRYAYLLKYRAAGSPNDVFQLNRVNFDFLLKEYQKVEGLKEQVRYLKKELRGVGV